MSIESSELNAGTVDLDLRYKFDFIDPVVSADPFPYYRALLATPPIIAQRQIPWAIVSRYDDVVKVLRDHQGYSSVNPHWPCAGWRTWQLDSWSWLRESWTSIGKGSAKSTRYVIWLRSYQSGRSATC
jgi:hypothetical protein